MMQGKEYLALIDAYEATRGFQIYNLKLTLEVSFNTFIGNQIELEHLLQKHSGFDPRLHGPLNRNHLQAEFNEIIRLLHNYCAAVMSLVEHTRRVARKIIPAGQITIYQGQIDVRFKNNLTHCFLQDLRNYLLHESNAPVAHVTNYGEPHVPIAGIVLPQKPLLEWSNWNKLARKFILQHGDGIVLDSVVRNYTADVVAFLQWLDDYIELVCKAELDEFWKKHDAWAIFCKSQGIPSTEAELGEALKD